MTLFAENNSLIDSNKKVERINFFEMLMPKKEKPTFTPDMDSDTIVKIIVDSMMVELHKEFERVGLKPKSTNIEDSVTTE